MVMIFLTSASPLTQNQTPRCRSSWECDEKMQTEVAWTEREDDAAYVKVCTRLVVEGKAPVGRPRKTMRPLKVDHHD